MQNWVSPQEISNNTEWNDELLEHIGQCDLIASASDRNSIGRISPQYSSVTYGEKGLEISHLLSGESQWLELQSWKDQLGSENQDDFLKHVEESCIPESIRTCTDSRKVFWWFWRCYPDVLAKQAPETQLLPAENRLPDGSLWSHTSITAALAGALAGYYQNSQDYPRKDQTFQGKASHPHIASFTFTPVQELIQASRKLRDFWAGSWLLHYLSAKVCWEIAWKYGPDTFVYPCLYAQPLIDHWLLKKYADFSEWIEKPDEKSINALLTAGFPNVLVMVLPDNAQPLEAKSGNPVKSAMQYANEVLKKEWKLIGALVLEQLERKSPEWKNIYPKLWHSWLESYWQSYWVALPLGDRNSKLHQSPRKQDGFEQWTKTQNTFARPAKDLFLDCEVQFFNRMSGIDNDLNVGSWWASIFDQVRHNLTAVKSARVWSLPTAFGPRSTISGIGSVLHPIYDPMRPEWATEGETQHFWKSHAGLFNGREELNATEVLKRGLHQVLYQEGLLGVPELKPDSSSAEVSILYPDLSSGVAGWVHQLKPQSQQSDQQSAQAIDHYKSACEKILEKFPWSEKLRTAPWGIPWIQAYHCDLPNPRLLNAGWLIEEYEGEAVQEELGKIKTLVQQYFPRNNPTDWYVLAAGDGDGMSRWLKGTPLKSYRYYIPEILKLKFEELPDTCNSQPFREPLQEFLEVKKRMGPATHSALSRALLDFSNQLVPYLTEQRYAGRLIYGGGDDVLAYINLWEWDRWLWDIHECFRGQRDPNGRTRLPHLPMGEEADPESEFISKGDYWRWKTEELPENIAPRPLFTMGNAATISFGITIANQGVPLAIALENLREAEKEAKEHFCAETNPKKKDAVQVRVLYGNGNVLKATAKFNTFNQWRDLLVRTPDLEPALFEQAAQLWKQHPVPLGEAIPAWTKAFCERREALTEDTKFQPSLEEFLTAIWQTSSEKDRSREVQNWLKLAAFVLRKRKIELGEVA